LTDGKRFQFGPRRFLWVCIPRAWVVGGSVLSSELIPQVLPFIAMFNGIEALNDHVKNVKTFYKTPTGVTNSCMLFVNGTYFCFVRLLRFRQSEEHFMVTFYTFVVSFSRDRAVTYFRVLRSTCSDIITGERLNGFLWNLVCSLCHWELVQSRALLISCHCRYQRDGF
jgi:hypothetical protein